MSSRIDSSEAWVVAAVSLAIASTCFGAPLVVTVALQPVAADLGGFRSVPAAAISLAMLGTGVGGLVMAWLAERIGFRRVVMLGATMVCAGLALSTGGQTWQLYVGHGLLIGLLGNGAVHSPLYVYITRWFEARRGSALAFIASGQYVAGAAWPPLFERAIAAWGWRATMIGFGVLVMAVAIPLAAIFLKPAPDAPEAKPGAPASGVENGTALGLRPNVLMVLLSAAAFLCCVPMAMPASHLIAFCGDLGIAARTGAVMLSVLLVCAFLSRQLWGLISDRIGGLMTLLVGSLAQVTAMTGFLLTQDEAGLFFVAAAFGLGFAGLVPAYMLTVRQLFPAREAVWRMPVVLLTAMAGMAAGSWLAGIIYDGAGAYAPAFALGIVANLGHLAIIGSLVMQRRRAAAREALAV